MRGSGTQGRYRSPRAAHPAPARRGHAARPAY
jgi:hypothetical protein